MTQTNSKKRKLEESREEHDNATSFPPPFTSKTLEQRLRKGIMVQSGGQKGSLTRCVQKYALLTAPITTEESSSSSSSSSSENKKQELLREFLQELQLYRMDLTRSVLLTRNLQREIQQNTAIEEALEQEIEETKTKVHECQQQAKRAKQVQSCFMEYEALSKLANNCLEQDNDTSTTTNNNASIIHSTRQLKSEIARVKQEIASNQKEETKLDAILAVRKNQFHLLIQCMLDLKRSLDDDDDDDDDDDEQDGEEDNKGTDKGNDEEEEAAMQVDEEGAVDDDDDNLYGDLG